MTTASFDRAQDISAEKREIEHSIKQLEAANNDTFPTKDYNKSEIRFTFGTWRTIIDLYTVTAGDFIFIKSYMLARYKARLADLKSEFDKL